MKKIIAFALIGLACTGASAEKADAAKQAVIDYNNLHADEVTQTTTLTGDVMVTKGSLVLRADQAVVKQTPQDDLQVTLSGAPGKLASFRQKRDGGPDLWVEGEAQRIEYDERSAVMKLFGSAKIRQLEGKRLTDEIQSEYITYDSLREVFAARNEGAGVRGRMIIAPRKPRPAAADSPATPAVPAVTP